jgi:DNA mismatch repair protein MutS2
MAHSSARVLEFDSLRELLRGYTASDPGRTRVFALAPSTDLAWIQNQQQLTAEVREFRRAGGNFSFFGLTPISELLENAGISGVALEALEIVSVTTVVDRAAEWREIALRPPQGMRQEWTAVRQLSSGIADFNEFLRGFRNKILPDGTLDDKASPALASIRRQIEKQKRGIQESLRGHLRRLAEGGAVQDELITIRGERFVIPVKAEQKRRVQGVVHGASSSGQTVFVEPLETIEQNNELVRLLEDEQAEVRRILLEMTRRIGERASEIGAALEILAEVELQFAKAWFAEEYDCVTPEFVSEESSSRLILRDARHPLLERNLKSTSKAPLLAKDARNGAPGIASLKTGCARDDGQ